MYRHWIQLDSELDSPAKITKIQVCTLTLYSATCFSKRHKELTMQRRERSDSEESWWESVKTDGAIWITISKTRSRAWVSSKQVQQILSCRDSMNALSARFAPDWIWKYSKGIFKWLALNKLLFIFRIYFLEKSNKFREGPVQLIQNRMNVSWCQFGVLNKNSRNMTLEDRRWSWGWEY